MGIGGSASGRWWGRAAIGGSCPSAWKRVGARCGGKGSSAGFETRHRRGEARAGGQRRGDLPAAVQHRSTPPARAAARRASHRAHDPEAGLAWLVVSQAMIERTGAEPDDLVGLSEYVRSLEGTRVALTFRETTDGQTRISLRSTGAADVNRHRARVRRRRASQGIRRAGQRPPRRGDAPRARGGAAGAGGGVGAAPRARPYRRRAAGEGGRRAGWNGPAGAVLRRTASRPPRTAS